MWGSDIPEIVLQTVSGLLTWLSPAGSETLTAGLSATRKTDTQNNQSVSQSVSEF